MGTTPKRFQIVRVATAFVLVPAVATFLLCCSHNDTATRTKGSAHSSGPEQEARHPSRTGNGAGEPALRARAESADYFPLCVGDTWEYRVVIADRGDFYTLNDHLGMGAPVAVGRKLAEGTLALKFAIQSRDGPRCRVQVIRDELGLFGHGDSVFLREVMTGTPLGESGITLVEFLV